MKPTGFPNVVASAKVSLSDVLSNVGMDDRFNPTKGSSSIIPIVDGKDTVMYIVNYSEGWELVSANRNFGPIVAHADSGYLTENDLASNPALESYISTVIDEIKSSDECPIQFSSLSSSPSGASMPPSFYDEDGTWWAYAGKRTIYSSTNEQPPLLRTKWGQGSSPSTYWNISSPYTSSSMGSHCLTGCTMVAIAQVLYYLHETQGIPQNSYSQCVCNAYVPDGSTLNYCTLNGSNTSFLNNTDCWSSMPLAASSTLSPNDYVCASNLMTRLGQLLGARYYSYHTDAGFQAVPSSLSTEYGVSCSRTTNVNTQTMIQQIYTLHKPVVVGMVNSNNVTQAHAVVFDGYRKVSERYAHVYKTMDESETRYQYFYGNSTEEYFSINWGYDGHGDVSPSTGAPIWYSIGNSYSYTNPNGIVTNYNLEEMVYNFN